jgi:hypothetical protein
VRHVGESIHALVCMKIGPVTTTMDVRLDDVEPYMIPPVPLPGHMENTPVALDLNFDMDDADFQDLSFVPADSQDPSVVQYGAAQPGLSSFFAEEASFGTFLSLQLGHNSNAGSIPNGLPRSDTLAMILSSDEPYSQTEGRVYNGLQRSDTLGTIPTSDQPLSHIDEVDTLMTALKDAWDERYCSSQDLQLWRRKPKSSGDEEVGDGKILLEPSFVGSDERDMINDLSNALNATPVNSQESLHKSVMLKDPVKMPISESPVSDARSYVEQWVSM